MADSAPYLTIALPVKDGEARLQQMLEEVDAVIARLGKPCEVLAVDDGSTDGTRAILERFADDHGYLRVLVHDENRGKGAALKTAAAASRGTLLLTVDSDATYQLNTLDDFLEALEQGKDASIANRRDPRSQFLLNPRDFAYIARRHAVSGVYVALARLIAGVRVSDCQAGYKCYRGDVARRLFPMVEADRFAFDVEILALLQHRGHAVAELPVVYVYRHQPSTVKLFGDGMRMFRYLLYIRRKLKRLERADRLDSLADQAREA